MKADIALLESILKIRADGEKPAKLVLTDGENTKEYDLYFVLDKNIIEVVTKKGQPIGKRLTKQERSAIIEALLDEFCAFYKSVYHFTINYSFEHYRLVDSTYVTKWRESDDLYKQTDPIILEYVKGDYIKSSKNIVYRVLKTVYDKLYNDFRAGKFSGEITIPIEYRLTRVQSMDLRYFINQVIHEKQWACGADFFTDVDRKNDQVIITVEELD